MFIHTFVKWYTVYGMVLLHVDEINDYFLNFVIFPLDSFFMFLYVLIWRVCGAVCMFLSGRLSFILLLLVVAAALLLGCWHISFRFTSKSKSMSGFFAIVHNVISALVYGPSHHVINMRPKTSFGIILVKTIITEGKAKCCPASIQSLRISYEKYF